MRLNQVCVDGRAVVTIAMALILSSETPAAEFARTAHREMSVQSADDLRITKINELISIGVQFQFAGDFDAADATWSQIRALDPSHPAASIHATTTRFWRKMSGGLETNGTALVAEVHRSIKLSKARCKATPSDPEAHYYLGTALMQQARIKLENHNFLSAGAIGEKGRVELERALELRPDWVDAKYQLGLFYYYAGILPDILKWLSWLWFIPSGDMNVGLAYLEEVSREGTVHHDAALFTLGGLLAHNPPKQPTRALEIFRGLLARYPTNSLIRFEVVDVLMELEQFEEVIAESRLLEASSNDAMRLLAQLWRSRSQLRLGHTTEAFSTMNALGPELPTQPVWAGAWVILTRGQLFDVQGDRESAREQYLRVTKLEGEQYSLRAAGQAEAGLEERFSATTALHSLER